MASLGALPWTYILRWFDIQDVNPLRLACRSLRTAVDNSIEAITITGSDAAAGLLTSCIAQRLLQVQCVVYHPGNSQGGGSEGQALADLLTAITKAAPGRMRQLRIAEAAVTASMRQAQRYSLAFEVLSHISHLTDWTDLDVPVNPASIPTRAAIHNQASAPDNPLSTSSSPSIPPFKSSPAPRSTLSPSSSSSSFSSSLPSTTTAWADLLPAHLHRLTLRLTRQLSDVSCLSFLAPTLTSLNITNFTGSTPAHAAALGQLCRLTALELAWPIPRISRPAKQHPHEAVVATAYAGQVVTARANTFWQIIGASLIHLRCLIVRGDETQISLLDCVISNPHLTSLEVHLHEAYAYPRLLLAALAILPHLSSLHLHNLTFMPNLHQHVRTPTLADTKGWATADVPIQPDLWRLLLTAAEVSIDPSASIVLSAVEHVCDRELHTPALDPSGVVRRLFEQLERLSMSATPSTCVKAAIFLCAHNDNPNVLGPSTPLHTLIISYPSGMHETWMYSLPMLKHLQHLSLIGIRQQMLGTPAVEHWCNQHVFSRLTTLNLDFSGSFLLQGPGLKMITECCINLRALRLSKLLHLKGKHLRAWVRSSRHLSLLQVGQNWTADSDLRPYICQMISEFRAKVSFYACPEKPEDSAYTTIASNTHANGKSRLQQAPSEDQQQNHGQQQQHDHSGRVHAPVIQFYRDVPEEETRVCWAWWKSQTLAIVSQAPVEVL